MIQYIYNDFTNSSFWKDFNAAANEFNLTRFLQTRCDGLILTSYNHEFINSIKLYFETEEDATMFVLKEC